MRPALAYFCCVCQPGTARPPIAARTAAAAAQRRHGSAFFRAGARIGTTAGAVSSGSRSDEVNGGEFHAGRGGEQVLLAAGLLQLRAAGRAGVQMFLHRLPLGGIEQVVQVFEHLGLARWA